MSDELDRLETALKAEKPSVNPDRKAKILAMARKSFDATQETAAQPRPTIKSAQNVPDIWTGVKDMFRSINLRPALYATSALCVGGLAIIITQPFTGGPIGPSNTFTEVDEIAQSEQVKNNTGDYDTTGVKSAEEKSVYSQD